MNDEKARKSKYFYWGLTAFFVVAACLLLFFLFFRLPSIMKYFGIIFKVVEPLIIGIIIAYLVNPIADLITEFVMKLSNKFPKRKKIISKIANGLGVLGAIAVFVTIILLIIYMVVPQFIDGITGLIKTLPGQLDNYVEKITGELKKNSEVREILIKLYNYEKNWLQNDLQKNVTSFASYFASSVWGVVNFIKNFTIGLIFAIYVLFNKSRLIKQFRKIMFACFKKSLVIHIFKTGRKANQIFSGFIYGKMLDSLIIGVICFIGVTIMKMPFTMLLAVVIGVSNIIPVFGPYIGGVPCTALIFLYDPVKGIYFAIFLILLQTFDGNFLGPKILGNTTGLSALWVVFAIIVGGGLFGIVGMIIGVPLFAVIYYLFSTFINYKIRRKNLPLDSDFYDKNACEKIGTESNDLQMKIEIDSEIQGG